MSLSHSIATEVDSVAAISSPNKQRGHVLPCRPIIDIDKPGRLRTSHVMALCGFSHSTLYNRMKDGVFPQPDGKDGGLNFWNTSTIRDFLETGAEGGVK